MLSRDSKVVGFAPLYHALGVISHVMKEHELMTKLNHICFVVWRSIFYSVQPQTW